jgi:hypothetical protein
MKFVIMTLLALSFQANAQTETVVNVTDYNACGSYTPGNQDIEGSWQMTQTQGEFSFTGILDFNHGTLTAINECSFRGRSLRAQIQGPASYGNGRINVNYSANRTEEINENGFHLDCSVSMQPTALNYSFRGRCLVLTQAGSNQEIVMVPR